MAAAGGAPRGPLNPAAPRSVGTWPSWAGVGLVAALGSLPYGAVVALGRTLGRAAYRIGGRRRIVADHNLALCFPHLAREERDEICRRHHEALGIGLFESSLCWRRRSDRLQRLARVEGLEHLDGAAATGRGLLMLSGHFTSLEVGGRILTASRPVGHVYAPPSNPVIRYLMTRGRGGYSSQSIPRENVRGLLRALKEGKAIWYASDQAFEGKGSRMVPFFGVPAPTNVALSRIARLGGALVVPFFCVRLPDARGYLVRILPALEDFPTGDEAADSLRYHHLLEEQIRRMPEQYLWSHDRFRHRPHKRDSLGGSPT